MNRWSNHDHVWSWCWGASEVDLGQWSSHIVLFHVWKRQQGRAWMQQWYGCQHEQWCYGSVILVTTMMVEHSLVHVASNKHQSLHQNLCKLLVPMATRLLQAIQGSQQVGDLSEGIGCGVARGLPHVNILILGKFTIQVSTFYVNLMKFEI